MNLDCDGSEKEQLINHEDHPTTLKTDMPFKFQTNLNHSNAPPSQDVLTDTPWILTVQNRGVVV